MAETPLARAKALAAEGTTLFGSGSWSEAAEKYTQALAALGDADKSVERVVCLNNRAAAYMRLNEPLKAIADSFDAVELCCEAEPLSRGLWVPLPGRCDVLLNAIKRHAAAYKAAGCALGALPLVTYGSAHRTPAGQALYTTACELRSALPPATGAGTLPARCTRLKLDARAGTPTERVRGTAACLGGHLYVIGGCDSPAFGGPVKDFWRLRVDRDDGRGTAWESLRKPGNAGGPSPGEETLCAAAKDSNELIVLHDGVLYSYDPGKEKWRLICKNALDCPVDDIGMHTPSALAVRGAHAYVYMRKRCHSRTVLTQVCLRTGSVEVLHSCAGDCASAPQCTLPHMWPAGESALLLWGGAAPEIDDNFQPVGHHCISPPPLGGMWSFDLAVRKWTRVPHGGGGAPPPARVEAGFTPLGDDGSCVVVGGYSELLPLLVITAPGKPPEICGYRYLDDVHVYRPGLGWCRLAPVSGAPIVSAACRLCGEHDGSVLLTGGYSNPDGTLSLADVFRVQLNADAGPSTGSLKSDVLRTLQRAPSMQTPQLPLPDEMFTTFAYETRQHTDCNWRALLDAALEAPQSPGSQVVMTWQEADMTVLSGQQFLPYQLSIYGDNPHTGFYHEEPQAADAMRALLLVCVPAAGPAFRPATLLLAARMGHLLTAMMPLFELLGIGAKLETWTAAALSALRSDTNPWGFNAIARCIRCKKSRTQAANSALKLCSGCNLARYCSAACQRSDWLMHKEMCKFIADFRGVGGE